MSIPAAGPGSTVKNEIKATLAPGSRLGPYEILAPLGKGGMGEVYRGRDPRLDREVAIKVIPPEFSADPVRLRRFEQEARSASALNHPNIITIYEIETVDATTFLVMELIDGETLRELLLAGALPTRQVLDIGGQVAEGLGKAHASGIVHRDLKPENLMITRDGFAKILDFGLAKYSRPGNDTDGTVDETMTQTGTAEGTVLGTIGYMSPEQAMGTPADFRSDQFSFGAILYEMATGERAFRRKTAIETLSAILRDDPEPIARRNAEAPAPLQWIVDRCLAKDPEQRYGSTRDLARDLRQLRDHPAGLLVGSASHSIQPNPAQAPETPAIMVRPSKRRLRPLWAVVALVAALAAGAAIRLRVLDRPRIDSLAVLPFAYSAGNVDGEYLSDGLTESVIHSLSQLPKLRVIALSSVERYKGKEPDPRAAGRELGVGAMVTGRVVRRPAGLSIDAELVDARDGSRLWGEHYETRLADLATIQKIQEDVSIRVSENLKLTLTGEEKKRLTKRYTENSEAYSLYLKGRYHSYKFTTEGYKKSLEYYQQAIEKDPLYALAYAGLADSYSAMGVDGALPPGEAFQKVQAAARKALELDDTLGEAHSSMALVKQWKDHDWAGAEEEFRRAIALSPSYAEAHHFLAINLRNLGRFPEAIDEMRRAQELDPLQPYNYANLGRLYFWAGLHDKALDQYRKTLELDPNYPGLHDDLADVLERTGKDKEALAERQRALVLEGDEDEAASLGRDAASHGYRTALRGFWQRRLDLSHELAKDQYVSPMDFAIIAAQLGDKDQAFAWLLKALEGERSPWLANLKVDPQFDSLRSDPRFAGILRRAGLPEK